MAFDSLVPADVLKIAIGKRVSGAVHGEITRDALKPLAVKDEIVKRIVEANWRTDWNESQKTLPPAPNEHYDPAHHFDRNAGDTHAESFIRAAKFVREQRKIIVSGLKGEDGKTLNDAVAAFGQAMHALQDFFSHSNVIDLSPKDWEATIKALHDASEPPPSLKITGYDRVRGKDLENDGFGHDAFSKDNAKKNDEAKSPMKEGAKDFVAGKTKFQRAKEAATVHSRLWLEAIKTEVGANAWKQLQ